MQELKAHAPYWECAAEAEKQLRAQSGVARVAYFLLTDSVPLRQEAVAAFNTAASPDRLIVTDVAPVHINKWTLEETLPGGGLKVAPVRRRLVEAFGALRL